MGTRDGSVKEVKRAVEEAVILVDWSNGDT